MHVLAPKVAAIMLDFGLDWISLLSYLFVNTFEVNITELKTATYITFYEYFQRNYGQSDVSDFVESEEGELVRWLLPP